MGARIKACIGHVVGFTLSGVRLALTVCYDCYHDKLILLLYDGYGVLRKTNMFQTIAYHDCLFLGSGGHWGILYLRCICIATHKRCSFTLSRCVEQIWMYIGG